MADEEGRRAQEPESAGGGALVPREDLELVIRRALELSLAEAEAEDRLTEQDVVRIAGEVGLPPQHVWRALYERPSMTGRSILGERFFDSPILVAGRVVDGDAAALRRRMENYLTTYEYLTVARRIGDEVRLLPAEDTISSVARVFARPSKRHHLAHMQRVGIAAHQLPKGRSAVRIETDLSDKRRELRTGALVLGGVAGTGLMPFVVLSADAMVGGALTGVVATAGTLGVYAATIGGALSIAGRRFRTKLSEARAELDGLLDRVETGGSLEPPPAPWRRRLRSRLLGDGG